MKTRLKSWLRLVASMTLLGSHAQAASITLVLFEPERRGCGDVSVNGYVWATDASIERVVWSWGDGTTKESWFPATHGYATNGAYTVQATAFASDGDTRSETVAVPSMTRATRTAATSNSS